MKHLLFILILVLIVATAQAIPATAQSQDRAALGASAYVVLQDAPPPQSERAKPPAAIRPLPSSISIPNAGDDALLNKLKITPPKTAAECRQPCSMLRSEASSDSIVFVLQHQANQGLVRLAGNVCRQRTAATLVLAGDTFGFPIATTSVNPIDVSESFEWALQPDADIYYAVAVTDANVARQLANHIDALPLRCFNSFRQGLSGQELRDWLSEFAMQSARLLQHFDWRAIQVRDIT